MKKYILSLDQGTTSSRAMIFNKEQEIIGVAQKEFTQIFPQNGWVEHDPLEIWSSQYSVLQEVLAKSDINPEEIAAIGITNQRETTIVWEKATGKPVYNAIVWQCRRTAQICDQIKKDGLEEYINKKTGLVVDAYFSGTKVKWILDNVEGAREKAENGELLFGTVDSWLIWKLTNGECHITDYTNASRTMLYDIENLKWDNKILEYLNIPKSMLPKVKNSSEIYGYANLGGGLSNIKVPIASAIGDQQAALFGQGCFEKGDVKNTYGTGCFLLMNTGTKMYTSKNGLLTTIAVGIDGKVEYALEGSVFVGGAVIQWVRDQLGLIREASDSEYFAKKVKDNNGVYVVPAFTGIGAPYWDMYARGTITGLTRDSNRNHIIRASLESIAYQSKDLIEAMQEDVGYGISKVKVDGGASNNDLLMQFQADILEEKVIRPSNTETTALGAGYLAGLAVGFWKDKEEIKKMTSISKTFSPKLDKEIVKKYYKGWKIAVDKTLYINKEG